MATKAELYTYTGGLALCQTPTHLIGKISVIFGIVYRFNDYNTVNNSFLLSVFYVVFLMHHALSIGKPYLQKADIIRNSIDLNDF